jgi:hypothetical protein
MRVNCRLIKWIGRSSSAGAILALVAFQTLFTARAEAQWFPFGGGYRYKSVTRSGPGLNLFHGGTMMMAPSLGVSPVMGQSLAFSPVMTGQSLGLSPTTLSLSPQPTYFLSGGTSSGMTLSLAPQPTFQLIQGTNSGATLALSPQFNGVQTITLTGSPTAEHGMQVLSLGFGNDPTKVNGFLQGLKNKLEGLVGAVGKNLTKQDVEDFLMTAAKSALAGSGFGFAGPALDLFLKPLIDKLIGDRLPAGDGTPATPTPATPTPATPTSPIAVPSGGMSFNVSGTIVLTPASGGGAAPVRGNGNVTPAQPSDFKTEPGGTAAPVVGGPGQ